jgi:hypothetical protein
MALMKQRRRNRRLDPLANPEAVRHVIEQLQAILPNIVPNQEKQVEKLLRAVRHISRYPASDTNRGRPSPWRRKDLLRVSARLSAILQRQGSTISPASFIDHHLRILHFPGDVVTALKKGDVNLFEAEQLARIRAGHSDWTAVEARKRRAKMLAAHLQARLSGKRLQQRVNELLTGEEGRKRKPTRARGRSRAASLDDFDPYDTTHLFYDEIKMLGFALRDIKREDLTDATLEELLRACDRLRAVIGKVQKRDKKSL